MKVFTKLLDLGLVVAGRVEIHVATGVCTLMELLFASASVLSEEREAYLVILEMLWPFPHSQGWHLAAKVATSLGVKEPR